MGVIIFSGKRLFACAVLLLASTCARADNFYWAGSTSSAWGDRTNWRTLTLSLVYVTPANPPTATDDVLIGTDGLLTITNQPVISDTRICNSMTFGGAFPVLSLQVDGALTVSGDIVKLHKNTTGGHTTTLSGSGSITCVNLQLGSNVAPPTSTAAVLNNMILTNQALTVTGNIVLISIGKSPSNGLNYPALDLNRGTLNLNGQLTTQTFATAFTSASSTGNPQYGGRGQFSMDNTADNTTLILRNATPVPSLGTNFVVDFTNNGTGTSTVNYASASGSQTVYTSTLTGIGINNANYDNLVFSGGGTKLVNGGTLSVGNNFDNSANTTADFLTNNTNVIFYTNIPNTPASTNMIDGGTAGTTFNRLTVSLNSPGSPAIPATPGTATIRNVVNIAPTGVLTVNLGCTLDATTLSTNNLFLKSTAAGSASVAALSGGSSITGNVNVERYVKGSYGRGYRLISSPVNNAAIAADLNYYTVASLRNVTLFGTNSTLITGPAGGGWDVSNLNNPSIWVYREADSYPANSRIKDSDYKGLLRTTTPVPVGSGLLFFNRGNRSNSTAKLYGSAFPTPEEYAITFRGALNQGTVQARAVNNDLENFTETSTFNPLTRYYYNGSLAPASNSLSYTVLTGTANTATNGLNLLGNPYASTIDLDAVTMTSVNLFLYVFNPANRQFSYYQKGSATSGTAVVDGNGASRYLASGQGFFARATSNAATVTFAESNKVLNQPVPAGTPLLLMGKPATAPAAGLPRLMLQMKKDSIDYDGIGIYFHPDAKDSLDMLDAPDLDGMSPQVFFSSVSAGRKRLAINMLPELNATQRVPLFVNATTSGLFSLEKIEEAAIPAVYDIWLQDHFTKDSLDLRENTAYTFRISKSDSASFGDTRFELIFRKKPLAPYRLVNFTGENSSGKPLLRWNVLNEYVYTQFTLQRQNESGFGAIHDMQSDGRGVYTYTDSSARNATNTYRLKQTDFNGKITYSEPVTVSSSRTTPANGTGIYPNPVAAFLNIRVADPATKALQLRILDLNGRVLATSALTGTNLRQNVASLKTGAYIAEIRVIKNGKVSYHRHPFIKTGG